MVANIDFAGNNVAGGKLYVRRVAEHDEKFLLLLSFVPTDPSAPAQHIGFFADRWNADAVFPLQRPGDDHFVYPEGQEAEMVAMLSSYALGQPRWPWWGRLILRVLKRFHIVRVPTKASIGTLFEKAEAYFNER